MAQTRPAPARSDSAAGHGHARGPAPRSPAAGRTPRAALAATLLTLVAGVVGTVAGLLGPRQTRALICGVDLAAEAAAFTALILLRRNASADTIDTDGRPDGAPRRPARLGGQGKNPDLFEPPPDVAGYEVIPAGRAASPPAPPTIGPELGLNVRRAYVSLARRIQALVNRQLRELREMEHRHGADPTVFADLLHLDHATALIGRLADSLAVLGGEQPGRRWTRPAPLLDVLRGAMSRITEYRRVTIGPLPERAAVAGEAVEGLVHALAELLDNATRYSPPDTRVVIGATVLADGLVIEVEDSGVGLGPQARERAALVLATENAGLEVAALGATPRLGLAVVGRLARAVGFEVSLGPADGGGVRASILIPRALVTEAPERDEAAVAANGRAQRAAPYDPPPARHASAAALGTVNGLPRRRRASPAPGDALAAPPPPVPAAPSPTPAPEARPGPGQWLGSLPTGTRPEGMTPGRAPGPTPGPLRPESNPSPRKKKEGMQP